MWYLRKITIENIVSFKEAVFEIEQGVATLIFGRNEDNSAQPNNGSGKSSLIEAISFALTGEQLRKVKSVEEIINDFADFASVEVELWNDYDHTTFCISRQLARRSPQVIECHKFDENGVEIEKDKTIQPTVLDYNRFILEEIGLTKDDIYNNFILCDNKYEGFFDCSDKSKKEIINRFSNGTLVDVGLAKILVDRMPIEDELGGVENGIAHLKGAIAAVNHELEQAENKKSDAAIRRKERILHLEESIIECRNSIEDAQNKKQKSSERMAELIDVKAELAELESSDKSFTELYEEVSAMCLSHNLGAVNNYEELSAQFKGELNKLRECIIVKCNEITTASDTLSEHKNNYCSLTESYENYKETMERQCASDRQSIQLIEKTLDAIDLKLDGLESTLKADKSKQSDIEGRIANLTAILSGAVSCPQCHFQFIPSSGESKEHAEQSLTNLREERELCLREIQDIRNEWSELSKEGKVQEAEIEKHEQSIETNKAAVREYAAKLDMASQTINSLETKVMTLKRSLTETENECARLENKIGMLRSKMFGEVEMLIENRIATGKSCLEQIESTIAYQQGCLDQYRLSMKELESAHEADFTSSLKESAKQYSAEMKIEEDKAMALRSKLRALIEQEVNFTLFKSYLARKKINALSMIINDFLEKIGSDIRLRLDGFSVTKTGKVRDKISVQVVRDGVDCGSYYKFSGGERARLNLACILALHTLTNANCEDGKGLGFLIVDELLDKSDEMGMATYCEALNRIGQTALLITQGNVAENYPHKLLIVKKQGISSIITT